MNYEIGLELIQNLKKRGININNFIRSLRLDAFLLDDVETSDFDWQNTIETHEPFKGTGTIILTDKISEQLFELNDGIIYNKLGTPLGSYLPYKDNLVPKNFKNEFDIIIDPITGEPLNEYKLIHSIFHDLNIEIEYCKYRYDIETNKLILTNHVL
jgi:hypothetical protein